MTEGRRQEDRIRDGGCIAAYRCYDDDEGGWPRLSPALVRVNAA